MKIDVILPSIAVAALLSSVAAPAGADTIYMKNGRVITSSSVRVEGESVYVRLLGGEVRLPLSVVDRIVVDDAVEEPPSLVPVPETASDPNDPAGQGSAAPGGAVVPSDAAVAAQIQRLEATRGGVQDQLNAILREARRLGVPAGWLR